MDNQKYLDMLDFLESTGKDSLYAQRETDFRRIPYAMEKTLYTFIQNGQPQEMIAFYRQMLLATPSIKVPIGKTSHDRLRQLKYAAVSAVAIACRYAIEGGATEALAYAKSDDAILRMDEMRTAVDILRVEVHTLIDYAKMVQQTKAQADHSPVVRACIEYITVHSHRTVTLEELASGTAYAKEYIAKRFKREVGVPISDYMLQVRINEAISLLKEGRACSEVAYTLGFSSQSYFNRQFKKVTGMTPRVYQSLHA